MLGIGLETYYCCGWKEEVTFLDPFSLGKESMEDDTPGVSREKVNYMTDA